MLYKQLSERNTNIWIKNIGKVISLNNILLKKSRERLELMQNEYTANYRSNIIGKLLNSSECVLIYGKIYENYNSFFPLRKVTPFTESELEVEYHSYEYFYNKKRDFVMTQERWSKYADRPFKVEEKDIIYYQTLEEFHNKSIEVAKGIGLDYEAFNLDEYSQNRG
jgi:hypothetical protein